MQTTIQIVEEFTRRIVEATEVQVTEKMLGALQIVEEFARQIVEATEAQVMEKMLGALKNGQNGHQAKHVPAAIVLPLPTTSLVSASVKAKPAEPKKTTTAQKRARLLQGAYMGNMRTLAAKDVAKVKAARAKLGIEAAIKLATKLKAQS